MIINTSKLTDNSILEDPNGNQWTVEILKTLGSKNIQVIPKPPITDKPNGGLEHKSPTDLVDWKVLNY